MTKSQGHPPHQRFQEVHVWLVVWCLLFGGMVGGAYSLAFSADKSEPKSNHMTCGSCPDGYATTGVTSAPSTCKDGDPILAQCVPLGAPLLSVCGACPEGYQTVGTSVVPSRCGGKGDGRMSQCQLENSGTK